MKARREEEMKRSTKEKKAERKEILKRGRDGRMKGKELKE